MYCPQCGTQNDDNAFRCVNCHKIIQPIPIQPRTNPIDDSQAMRMILPVGRSGLAIAAGYFWLVSVFCIFSPFVKRGFQAACMYGLLPESIFHK